MEINEELARWAGIKPFPIYPTGYDYPDFTSSLDACFEWLVPKLDNYEINNWSMKIKGKGWHRAYAGIKSGNFKVADAETPALALCRAIEQLIKEE